MSHTTFGIDINKTSIRYAVCTVNALNAPVDILELNTIPLTVTEEDDGLDEGLRTLAERMGQYKHLQMDAIGLALDPTLSMSLHRVLPFRDPRMIEQILPNQLAEIWKTDDEVQMSFEVGEFLPDADMGEGEEKGGFDIHAINYPQTPLRTILDRLKSAQIDPHVVLPSTEALNYLMNTAIAQQDAPWIMLDIGDSVSVLSVVVDGRVEMTRALKLGSANIDAVMAESFTLSPEEARTFKETCGFVAVHGVEQIQYEQFVSAGKIQPSQVNPADISGVCARGLEMLFTAVRQTLINFVSQKRIEPTCLYLTGGGSRLCGIDEWVSELFDIECVVGLPVVPSMRREIADDFARDVDAVSVAIAAAANIDGNCPLNLRRGAFAHKGSLAYLQDNKWVIASCVLMLIIALIFMTVAKGNAIKQEHDKLKTALEETTMNVFGKKMLSYQQIEREIESSGGYGFIPVRTAFTHFSWISNNVNDNLADVEMDLNSLDIDTQRKIVTIRGEVAGDDGLPRFMQLLETYECFPDEIQEPKTTKSNGKTSFTLRIDANHCTMGGDSE